MHIEANLKSYGSFSITFDIWTSNNQNSYLGIVLIYINSNFELKYKLIGIYFIIFIYSFIINILLGFIELLESHTGIYIFQQFNKALEQYPYLLNINNIFRYVILFYLYFYIFILEIY